MNELLAHPAVQGGVAPFVAGLAAALVLLPLRLSGLAATVAFLTGMYLVSGITFTPLTATRKIVLLAMAAPVVGILADFAFKPTRAGGVVIAAAAAGGALWAFWPVLAQKSSMEAWMQGAVACAAILMLAGTAQLKLATDGVRAGSAALGLGLAAGVAAILSASAAYGLYGIALGAGAGAFLLPQMITGRRWAGGATLALGALVTGGLIGAGTMVLAKLPWYTLIVLALVPLGACLPVPQRAPLWLQAVLLSSYCFALGAIACLLAWQFPDGIKL